MAPTTEKVRKFYLLEKNGKLRCFSADTICDVSDYEMSGTHFRFKRDGNVVGEARGDFHAWWLDDGAPGKTWRLNIGGYEITFAADGYTDEKKSRPCQKFTRSGHEVATIYSLYQDWSVSG